MKHLFLISLVFTLSTSAIAQNLLNCNPPMGSRLQEVSITQVENKIYRAELNFSGSYSSPIEISGASWAKKDLRWKSRNEGNVHLFQVIEDGKTYWAYQAKNIGTSVNGYCEE